MAGEGKAEPQEESRKQCKKYSDRDGIHLIDNLIKKGQERLSPGKGVFL
jgi:hypothetical protein